MGVKVFIDLRSKAELEEDEHLHEAKVYEGVQNFKFDKRKQEFIAEKGSDASADAARSQRKRYFVSLMSESLIKKGVFFRFKKRTRVS